MSRALAQGRSLVLAEALRALPSAVARPSQKDVPKPPTPPSPVSVIVALPAVEYLPYHRSPRLAPITNLSENGRKLLQKMSGVTPQVSPVAAAQTEMFEEIMAYYYNTHTHTLELQSYSGL